MPSGHADTVEVDAEDVETTMTPDDGDKIVMSGRRAAVFMTVPDSATVTATVVGRDVTLKVDGSGTLLLDANGKRANIKVHPDVDLNQRSLSGRDATVERYEVSPPRTTTEPTKAEKRLLDKTRSEALTAVTGFGRYGIRYQHPQRDKDYCDWCGADEPEAIAETVREEGFLLFGIAVSRSVTLLSDHCSNCHISEDKLRQEALQEMTQAEVEQQ